MLLQGTSSDLTSRINGLHGLAGERVPEADAAVRGAAAAGQQPVVMRRPGDRFHRRQVVRVGLHGPEAGQVPHEELVVVAAAGQVLVVRRPLEAAHLLPVTGQPPLGSCTQVCQPN